ncbi:unnamed protein product [Danaus chrysippus]|uniref:(African queen) hypothetical protein n=1 Tax=Danaus chrysippus TaxID=151541 RepID=A0A8J2W4S9_9NEOP|nr:unnamed protein product [Danaus chrysippus]
MRSERYSNKFKRTRELMTHEKRMNVLVHQKKSRDQRDCAVRRLPKSGRTIVQVDPEPACSYRDRSLFSHHYPRRRLQIYIQHNGLSAIEASLR